MKRLLLVLLLMLVLWLIPMNGHASQYVFPDYPDVFWSNLTYMGQPIDISVPPPDYYSEEKEIIKDWETVDHETYYCAYLWTNKEACDILAWKDITFCYTDQPPYGDVDNSSNIVLWQRYFNEMYYAGGEKISSEDGFSPFWEGLRYNGKAVDPYKAPKNYSAEVDCWKDRRDEIGYAWYWSYHFVDVYYEYFYMPEYQKAKNPPKEPTWTWYGAVFKPNSEPPGFDSRINTDPFYLNRHARGYLDGWEDYFNALYYENVPQPDESAGEYYAWIKIKDKDSYLNARKKTSSSSKSLAKLEYADRITVVGKPDKNGWVKVIYKMDITAETQADGNVTVTAKPHYGYVKEKYLSKSPL